MKKLLAAALMMVISLTMIQCSDKGGDDPKPCSETQLVVTTTPAVGSSTPAQVGADFPVTINITAGFPAGGASINVIAKNEGTNAVFFETSPAATAGVNNVTITGTPAGATILVQVTVTSKNCASNKWTGSFRYSRK